MRKRSRRPIVQCIMMATMCLTAASPRASAQAGQPKAAPPSAQGGQQKPAPPPAQTGSQKAAPPARAAVAAKAMTNADVIKMVQGGLGDDLIIIAIRKTSRTAFDLTADGLLDLKSKGVSATLLRVMLDPTAKVDATPAPVTAVAPPPVAKPAASASDASAPAPPARASDEAAGRNPRREPEPPSKPASASGGATFTVAKAFDSTYETVVNYLKKQGQTIDSASRDTGQIVTAMTITGGRTQTGRRVQITLIKDAVDSTTIRVAITTQNRRQTGPWDDPKVDPKQSQLAADELKAVLAAA
jgi:hypothetical protein